MNLLSVIIPAHNAQKTIRNTIESVLRQSHGNVEIIVVDDGSTDNTKHIVNSLKETGVRLIIQKKQGPGAARNRGMKEARGEYLSFLDADDTWHPDKLTVEISLLKRTGKKAIFSGVFVIDNEKISKIISTTSASYRSLLIINNVATGSNITIHESLKHIQFNESSVFCQDYEYALVLAKRKHLAANPLPLVFYHEPETYNADKIQYHQFFYEQYSKTLSGWDKSLFRSSMYLHFFYLHMHGKKIFTKYILYSLLTNPFVILYKSFIFIRNKINVPLYSHAIKTD
jgi:glycosyltransferase involved in cell wall biosynthesis